MQCILVKSDEFDSCSLLYILMLLLARLARSAAITLVPENIHYFFSKNRSIRATTDLNKFNKGNKIWSKASIAILLVHGTGLAWRTWARTFFLTKISLSSLRWFSSKNRYTIDPALDAYIDLIFFVLSSTAETKESLNTCTFKSSLVLYSSHDWSLSKAIPLKHLENFEKFWLKLGRNLW